MHIEDGAVGDALVEVEAAVFSIPDALNRGEIAGYLVELEVEWNFSFEDHTANISSFILLPDTNHRDRCSDILRHHD